MIGEEWTQWVHRENILTNNDRKHFQVTKEPKANLRTLGAVAARGMRHQRVRLDVEVAYPPRVMMDAANLQATVKAYVDGMVSPHGKRDKAAGLLPDDSDKFFSGPFIHWAGWPSGKESWFIFRFRITPLEPWVKPPKPDWIP